MKKKLIVWLLNQTYLYAGEMPKELCNINIYPMITTQMVILSSFLIDDTENIPKTNIILVKMKHFIGRFFNKLPVLYLYSVIIQISINIINISMKGLVLKKVKGITVILLLLLFPLVECCTDGLNGCSTCNTSINQCTTCIGGYFNSSGYCYTCSSVCKTCSLYLDCTSCYDGSYWSSSILWCYACSSNCKTCSSSQSTCNSCYQGNYLNNYRCYSCNSNCTKCLSSSICQACVSNYFLNNGTCQLCGSQCSTSQVASNTNIIIAIAISSTVFIVIVVIIIIFGKRKCQQTDLQANPFPPSDLEANPFPASFYAMNVPVQPSMVIIQPIKWVRIDSQQFKKSCAICLGQGNCQIKCGHIFHPHCISEWLKRNIACPMCRKEVDTFGIVVVCEKCFQFGFRSNLKDLIKAKPTDFRLLHKCM